MGKDAHCGGRRSSGVVFAALFYKAHRLWLHCSFHNALDDSTLCHGDSLTRNSARDLRRFCYFDLPGGNDVAFDMPADNDVIRLDRAGPEAVSCKDHAAVYFAVPVYFAADLVITAA